MNIIHAIILGLVEGITEFLPISSTGHMILVAKLLSLQETDFVKSFEVIIQLGAILAVAFTYWRSFLLKKDVWLKIIIAFIPTAIIGLALYKLIKAYLLGNAMVTVIALFLGGVLLLIIEKTHTEKDHHVDTITALTYRNAFLIGIGQSLSVIPGVSRSAASIMSALLLGTKRKVAVEFSFLLAIPTMLAATGLDLLTSELHFSLSEVSMLAVGLLVSFGVAFVTIKYFIKYVQKNTFTSFAWYRIVLAMVFWLLILR